MGIVKRGAGHMLSLRMACTEVLMDTPERRRMFRKTAQMQGGSSAGVYRSARMESAHHLSDRRCGNEQISVEHDVVHELSITCGSSQQLSEVEARRIVNWPTHRIRPCLQQGHSATSTPVKRNILSCVVSEGGSGGSGRRPSSSRHLGRSCFLQRLARKP